MRTGGERTAVVMPPGWSPRLLTGLGLMLAGSGLVHMAIRWPVQPSHIAIDLLVILGASFGFVYAGHWYRSRDARMERTRTMAAWIVGGGTLFGGMGVITLFVGSEEVRPVELVEVVHVTASAGMASGLLVGTIYLEALRQAEMAARAEARAETLLDERERLDELNELLRHYVLNAVNVITGYTQVLAEEVPPERVEALRTMDDRARLIATLIEHVQSIQLSDSGSESVELQAVLERVARDLRDRDGLAVETPTSVPAVRTDATHLAEVTALLCEVMGENTRGPGTLSITCDTDEDVATVGLTVRPATLPTEAYRALEEPVGSATGLRVYLAKRLLDGDGSLTLDEPRPDTVRCDLRVHVIDE